MDGATSDVPLILAGSVSLFVFVIAAAAVVLEEEEHMTLVNEAARVIGSTLVALRSRKRHSILDGDTRVTRRRVILWDRQRAQRQPQHVLTQHC
jgi:hypothetical protein